MEEKLKKHIQKFGSLKGFKMKHHAEIENHELYHKYENNFQLWAWHIINIVEEPLICSICNKNSTSFRGFKNGYNKYCSECGPKVGAQNAGLVLSKPILLLTSTCENCKIDFSFKTKNEKKKRKFCSKSCSTEFAHRNRSTIEKNKIDIKRKSTNLEKYDNEYVINSEYSRKKTFDKLGVEFPLQSKIVQSKAKENYFTKTGYDNPLKNPATVEKMIATKIKRYGDLLKPCYHSKDYTFPSGKTVKVQGYENKALDILLKTYNENDIIVGRKNIEQYTGVIKYKSSNGKIRTYYPDIYIISANTIIEVKSNYTFNLHKEKLESIKSSLTDSNFKFEVLVL